MKELVHRAPENERSDHHAPGKEKIFPKIELAIYGTQRSQDHREGGKGNRIEEGHRETAREITQVAGSRSLLRAWFAGRRKKTPCPHRDEENAPSDLQYDPVFLHRLRDPLQPEEHAERDDGIGHCHAEGSGEPGPAVRLDVLLETQQPDRTDRRGVHEA